MKHPHIRRPQRHAADRRAPPCTFIYQQCWYHEPEFGREDEQCAAVAALEHVKADLEEVARRVEAEEAESGVSSPARKNARYVMYRAWDTTPCSQPETNPPR